MTESIPRAKTIVFVHGHHFKPARNQLASIWSDALRWGIERDYPEKAGVFDATRREMAYYGDLTGNFLTGKGSAYDERLDVADRLNAFASLQGRTKRKKFKRFEYENLPGKTAIKEMLADVGSPLLGSLGLEKRAISKLLPEMVEYWSQGSTYGAATRERVGTVLTEILNRSDELMVVAHCMGAVVTYDVLWELSRSLAGHKVDVLLTLGCPLGNKTVQTKLAGYGQSGVERYPTNILSWTNIAAEDDFVCHDKTIADDYRAMLNHQLISSISDFRIYNMAIRYGKSNPHSSIGYLVHPRVSKLLADWL